MTIGGFAVAPGGRSAVAWCDTELFGPQGKPCGSTLKLAVNPLAEVVGVGAGWASMTWEGDAVIWRTRQVETVPRRMANSLRQHLTRQAADGKRYGPWLNCYGYVGWSRELSRYVGYNFDASRFFAPERCAGWATPAVEGAELMAAFDDDGLIGIALGQMARLRQMLPEAGTGFLQVATLTPGRITCRTLFDFQASQRVQRAWREATPSITAAAEEAPCLLNP